MYRIESSKNIEFFDILRYLLYITIFSIYFTPEVYIFIAAVTNITRINGENDKLTEAN